MFDIFLTASLVPLSMLIKLVGGRGHQMAIYRISLLNCGYSSPSKSAGSCFLLNYNLLTLVYTLSSLICVGLACTHCQILSPVVLFTPTNTAPDTVIWEGMVVVIIWNKNNLLQQLKTVLLTQTNSSSARVAAMRSIQQQNRKTKLRWNILETPLKVFLKFSWSTLDTFFKHPWNFLKTSLKLPRNNLWTSFKYVEAPLIHPLSEHP